MRGDNCYPDRGKWVKIPLSPANVDKRGVNKLGTLQRVTTKWRYTKFVDNFKKSGECNKMQVKKQNIALKRKKRESQMEIQIDRKEEKIKRKKERRVRKNLK